MLLIPQMLSTYLQGIQNTCLKSSKAAKSATHYLFAKALCFNDSQPEPLHLDNPKEDRTVKMPSFNNSNNPPRFSQVWGIERVQYPSLHSSTGSSLAQLWPNPAAYLGISAKPSGARLHLNREGRVQSPQVIHETSGCYSALESNCNIFFPPVRNQIYNPSQKIGLAVNSKKDVTFKHRRLYTTKELHCASFCSFFLAHN